MPVHARYHHGDLPSALMDAGEALLEERGLAGFTLRECARRAGVSHAAPAHHFGNATGLLTALAARGFDRLTAAVRAGRAQERPADLDGQMTATTRAYVQFARSEPELFRLMFRCDLLEVGSPTLIAAAMETFAELTSVIRQQRGEPAMDVSEMGELTSVTTLVEDILIGWCHIHGLAHLLIEGQLGPMHRDDEAAFIERVTAANAPRLGALMRH